MIHQLMGAPIIAARILTGEEIRSIIKPHLKSSLFL
jgi:hypothetical protein